MKRLRLLVLLLAAVLLAGTAFGQSYTLTIIHTNDTHARLEPVTLTLGGKRVEVGGVARRVTLFDMLRARETNPLFLDAGDVFQGTLYFNQFLGLADRYFMHRMGYAAMTLGNHEFDLGPDPLAAFLDGARFRVLGANADTSAEPSLMGRLTPWTIVEIGGQRVGIFGLVTPDTAFIANPGPTVRFTDPVEAARRAVRELSARGIDKIIALTHQGFPEDLELARQVDGIDVIVGGHSHTLLGTFPYPELRPQGEYPTLVRRPDGRQTLVVQAWEWGKVVGRLQVTFDAQGHVTAWAGNPILVTPDIPADTRAGDLIYALAAPVRQLRAQRVAETVTTLDGERATVRQREGNLANFIADGMRWKAAAAGVEIALQNGGGIRASIPAGPVTVGQTLEVLPFGNTLVVLDLTGGEILTALEHSAASWERVAGGFLSGVSGLRYGIDLARPAGSRIVEVEVWRDNRWHPLDPRENYRVVTNSFLAAGGDGYAVLAGARGYRVDTGFSDAEAFLEYARQIGRIEAPVEGRIRLLNAPR